MASDRKTEGLLKYTKERTKTALTNVDRAIKELIKKGLKINFNSVSNAAGVSKSFLYNQYEIKKRIETLRNQQKELPSPKQIKRNTSDNSKDVIITALRERVKRLEEENIKLKKQLEANLGNIYQKM
jgi:predicted nuclease with TOPRIM domain